MTRAAILIGVQCVPDLERLSAVLSGVRSMASWAESQGFASVTVLTDENRAVRAHDIGDAVRSVVDGGTTEQLVLYFAGHGLNIGYSEYWLLSGAPHDNSAAVNVEGSARAARYCGIPHVVFISDTCRTPARGLQEQALRGIDVFPVVIDGGPAHWVDLFFACGLGSPAFETAQSGVYTDSLVRALSGHVPDILERGDDSDGSTWVVRPWPLHEHLERDLEQRLAEHPATRLLTQRPEARICSPGTAWLSRVASPEPPEDPPVRSNGDPDTDPVVRSDHGRDTDQHLHRDRHPGEAWRWSPARAGQDAREALIHKVQPVRRAADVDAVRARRPSYALTEAEARARRFAPFTLAHDAALQVTGARLLRAESATSYVVSGDTDGTVDIALRSGTDVADVLLSVGRAGGAFPVLRGFRTTLTFDRGELIDVAIEPSVRSMWHEAYTARRHDLRTLAALVSTTARRGAMSLSQEQALWWATHIRIGDVLDPALAVVASYVWDALNLRDQVEDAHAILGTRLGLRLFDLELLTGGVAPAGVHPGHPLLARGWALLDTAGSGADDLTAALRPHLLSSMWTLFDDTGIGILRDATLAGR